MALIYPGNHLNALFLPALLNSLRPSVEGSLASLSLRGELSLGFRICKILAYERPRVRM